ncbi:MAG TPA: AMP-binding protein [Anaerolineae bacterium]|nr:AMP-binding protein [Anaerolineae bacterium]
MGLRAFTVYHLLQHNARTAGTAPAAIDAGRTLTHQQFLDRVDRLAAGFAACAIIKGDRVCVLAQNSIEYLELYGACAKTGAIAYPINWRLSAPEVQGVVALADPQMLVVGAAHLPQIEGLDLSRLRVRATLGGSAAGFIPLSDLYQASTLKPDPSPPDTSSSGVSGDDPFVIISTAAVAGVPRGAILTHNNLIMANLQVIASVVLTARDRHLAALPLFHIAGLGLSLAVLQAGGANVVLETFDPARAAQLIDEHHVTVMADFPPVLSMLLEARATLRAGAQWQSLAHVIGLDAPDTIQRLYAETGAKFWTGFGQSETTGLVTLVRADEKPGSAGKPTPLARVRCVNEAGEDVPVGEPGEIAVQGPIVFAGYWRDPDATDYALRNGWHHTGDVGRFDAEGYLTYVGRKPEKDLIKSGGENVYPAEVERVIRELPEVAAVCVIGVPDPTWSEAVKAVVELKPGHTLTAGQVSDSVARRIAAYKKPRYVDFVERLPRKPDGETDRDAVKAAHGKS